MGLLVMTFHLNMVFLSNLNIHSSTPNQVKKQQGMVVEMEKQNNY